MNTYITKDFYLACSIMSSGHEFIGSSAKGKTVWFEFRASDELRNLVDDFVNYDAFVNVRQFTKAMVRLRKELDKHKS